MDAANEDFSRQDVDPEMTMLTAEEVTEQSADGGDEVENLRRSLREAVHDDSVRPKMQCLMMDSSFSMVTMQGEDSGIAWETNPSRSATPWASESGDLAPPVPVRPATPGSHPAGKIIFVMDEDMISRQRKTKERASGQKSKAEKREALELSSDNISGRPELVEVSQPNVKAEEEGEQEEVADHQENKMQRLFSIVSEGSEILNIVVPPKIVTVDEEESREMVDNLSYLEEVPVPKASEEIQDNETLILGEPGIQLAQPATSSRVRLHGTMDPPGAPVARPPGRTAVGNLDYFEAFSLVDAQAPGGPAMISPGQVEPGAMALGESNSSETQRIAEEVINTNVDRDKSDTISLGEITSELLDEVFYAGTDSNPMKGLDSVQGGRAAAGSIARLPSKPSGSSLFGSQEDILTPIFLPEGPPKIIDPILLEEPKAMAFLYTDLYEEALGSRKKEEDAESVTSEKSFHSRHSDREARGYLEKFVLIDETPVVEVEHSDKEKPAEGEPRVLTGDGFEFQDFLPKGEQTEMQQGEEITDFFRSSANSSPCDDERLPPPLEEDDDTEIVSKKTPKTQKSVSIAEEKVPGAQPDPLSLSNFEFPLDEPDWEGLDDPPTAEDDVFKHEESWKHEGAMSKPDAPPRKKTTSAPKASLDLTPLTPVDVVPMQEQEEAGGKEQREEEKETASPAETTDEGDEVDGGEMPQVSEVALSEAVLAALQTEISVSESVQDGDENAAVQATDENAVKTEEREAGSEADTAAGHTELKETDVETDVNPKKLVESSAAAPPTKNKGQCIIL
ncbi:Cardiomyopathy-associated protein 5 [Oryzias melastigma]|uniref:Cardiomyopathy-associated protein 5 n=1 Tax=Oryzias melastigma TaxID=30732 RepID=A0A834KZD4_ORYME|nr:Cardiomyopathy-associated protein 5 [Oryzias melastigma]